MSDKPKDDPKAKVEEEAVVEDETEDNTDVVDPAEGPGGDVTISHIPNWKGP